MPSKIFEKRDLSLIEVSDKTVIELVAKETRIGLFPNTMTDDLSPAKRNPRNNASSADLTETQIERYYVQEILSGRLLPGVQIPSNRELANTWSTSCSTVQRALLNLVALGLVDRTKRRGTFVRGNMQRAMIGILFGPNLAEATASHYRVLSAAISNELNSEFLSCRVYDNLATYDKAQRDDILMHLAIDQKYYNFRGFAEIVALPRGKKLSDVVPESAPKVICDPFLRNNDILFDYTDFGHQIVAALHQKKCRNLWYLKIGKNSADKESVILSMKETASSLGMPAPTIISVPTERFGHYIEIDTDEFMTELLASERGKELPDAIILSDDVAARGAVFALLKRGIRIPDQVRIATLANEAVDIHYSVPVLRYDFPTVTMGREMANLLKLRMAGRVVPKGPILLKGSINGEGV